MTRKLKEHPEYPFSEENLEATVLEMERFVSEPPLSPLERGEVLEFVRLTRQYAFLERLIQGDILFELPVHLDLGMAPVEALAVQERELLGFGAVPGGELIDVLDERGIKTFRRSRGPESPDTVTGGFFYAGEAGPALLASAATKGETVFAVAHAYGHLVMDVSPYESRFCRWRHTDLENLSPYPAEERADRFARALLLPEPLVRALAADAAGEPENGPREAMIHRAAKACDVAPAVLWRRFGDLQLPRSESAPRPRPLPKNRKIDERRATDLPERFVNLALAAYGERLLGKPDLVRFLRIPPERLERFLKWCPIPRSRKPEGTEDGDPAPDEDGT